VKQYIGCDAHARYSVFVSVDETGRIGPRVRIDYLGRFSALLCVSALKWFDIKTSTNLCFDVCALR